MYSHGRVYWCRKGIKLIAVNTCTVMGKSIDVEGVKPIAVNTCTVMGKSIDAEKG